jgi:hypothetical protein
MAFLPLLFIERSFEKQNQKRIEQQTARKAGRGMPKQQKAKGFQEKIYRVVYTCTYKYKKYKAYRTKLIKTGNGKEVQIAFDGNGLNQTVSESR